MLDALIAYGADGLDGHCGLALEQRGVEEVEVECELQCVVR